MQAKAESTQKIGDVIVAYVDFGNVIAPDETTAAELAARHLERVLVRGSNLRLTTALARLARELRPTKEPARRTGTLASGAAR